MKARPRDLTEHGRIDPEFSFAGGALDRHDCAVIAPRMDFLVSVISHDDLASAWHLPLLIPLGALNPLIVTKRWLALQWGRHNKSDPRFT